MQRVWNEMTADRRHGALGGRGGVKMGDFGVGGRVYQRDYERKAGQGDGCTPSSYGWSSCFCITIPLILLIWTERTLYLTAGAIDEAGDLAVHIDSTYAVDENNGKLIFVQTDPSYPPVLKGTPPTDSYFQYEMPKDSGIGKRVTEYCQWAEMRHSKSTKTGKNPDYQDSDGKWHTGSDIYTEEVWYTYHKAWRNHRISSILFDNAAAYHNPQRDPAPSKTHISPQGIDLSGKASQIAGITISSQDMEPAMNAWKKLPIRKSNTGTGSVSHAALNAGFVEADHQYYYSRMPKGGWNSPLFKAGVSYLVDGVLDINSISSATGIEGLLSGAGLGWITKGTCDAGDIRVSFAARALPKVASLVGQQLAGQVGLMTYSNGASRLFLRPSLMTLETLLATTLSDDSWWQNLYRIGMFLCFIIGGVLFDLSSNISNPDWKLGSVLGSTLFTTIFALLSCFFYGIDDSLYAFVAFVLSVASLIFMLKCSGGKSKTA